MRQEKTLKICANHLVSPHVELNPNVGSDRSWVFTASDFADEELKTETFAIKFGNKEKAEKFKECVELAKKVNAKEIKPEELPELKEDDSDNKASSKEEAKAEKEEEKEDTEATQLAKDLDKVKVADDDDGK